MFRLELEGALETSSNGQLSSWELRGSWLLGLEPPGWEQVLPLAMGNVELSATQDPAKDLRRGIQLINQVLRFIPTHLQFDPLDARRLALSITDGPEVTLHLPIEQENKEKSFVGDFGRIPIHVDFGTLEFTFYRPAVPGEDGTDFPVTLPHFTLQWDGQPLTGPDPAHVELPSLELPSFQHSVKVELRWNTTRGCLELGNPDEHSDPGAFRAVLDDELSHIGADLTVAQAAIERLRRDIRERLRDPGNDPRALGRRYLELGATDAATRWLVNRGAAAVATIVSGLRGVFDDSSPAAPPGQLGQSSQKLAHGGLTRLGRAKSVAEGLGIVRETTRDLSTLLEQAAFASFRDAATSCATIRAFAATYNQLTSHPSLLEMAVQQLGAVLDALGPLRRQ